jgi:predicted dehydrogenase
LKSGKVKWGVLGVASIARRKVIPAMQQGKYSEIAAIASRDLGKAREAAGKLGIAKAYGSYEELLADPEIEAIYNPLPNHLHVPWSITALEAGKHVLCEKPMSTNVAEAEAMIAACKAARVKLMIAYRCHSEPTNLKAIQLIRQGALGQVQAIESAFGFNIAPGEWRLSKKLAGGGPLFDVGIYSLNACRYLTGEEPEHIAATASVIDQDGRFKEVEENVSWTMKFPSGIVASCNTTYGATMEGFFRVHGSKGWLEVSPAFNYDGLRLRGNVAGAQLDELNPARDPSHFLAEADHFSHCVQNEQEPKSPGEEGLRDMRYITQIYRSAEIAI